ncbi:MAG TPA: ATP-binding protein [Vicinamibacteria bacterium]|nr:ATP-binding protein [Vicinamibacteria bacterium]
MPRYLPRAAVIEAIERELSIAPLIVVAGARGSGKTTLLKSLLTRSKAGDPVALMKLEPLASTPELLESEFRRLAPPLFRGPRNAGTNAFDALLDGLRRRPKSSLLLLDDITEIRTFSYFRDVEDPLQHLITALQSRGRTVATSRHPFWVKRELPDLPLVEIPPMGAAELSEAGYPEAEALHAATGGMALHVRRLGETLEAHGLGIEEALSAELEEGGRIEAECRATLADLLHRARGYNACKAILRVLADEEELKLTEIARRMARTPGSTRDYLRWLEEVDLIEAREKRFSYVDKLLRLWMRIYGRGVIATPNDVRTEVARHLGSLAPVSVERSASSGYRLPPSPSEDLVEID